MFDLQPPRHISTLRYLAVHQAVDQGRVAALLWTSIIAACKVYALASCLRASWMEARAGTA
jgi:hypothetical protein